MYVAPSPLEEEDPLFAVRLAVIPVIGFAVGLATGSYMPMIYPTLMFGLMAGSRGAFNPGRAFGGPIAMSAMMWIMSGITSMLLGMPALLILVMGLVFFAGFFLILKTGNPAGMLLTITALLPSVMGMTSQDMMFLMRDEMTKAALFAAIFIPLLYAVFPVVTTRKDDPKYAPVHTTQVGLRAAIRAVVMVGLALWLYSILDASNVMLGVAAAFVLTFPTRQTLFAEAWQRTYGTVLGGGLALAILAAANLLGHLPLLLMLVFLASLLMTDRMMHGKHPAMVYQYAASVMLALVGTALVSQEPNYAFIQRVVLTLVGAVGAAVATSLLEALLLRPEDEAKLVAEGAAAAG
jgi:hypothetical protein